MKLSPGQQTFMDISYAPSSSGTDKEKIKLSSNDPSDPIQTIVVKGETADPDIDAPKLVDFGLSDVNVPIQKTITIENLGTGILDIAGINFSNSSATFTILKGFVGSINPGSSEKIEVEYVPDDHTSDNNSIEILSNDPADPLYIISLLGTPGIPQIALDRSSIDFGHIPISSTSASEKIEISNIGTGALNITSLALKTGTVFSWNTPLSLTIDPGKFIELEIEYAPVVYAPDVDELVINSTDPIQPSVLVSLSGWGSAPQLEIFPAPHDFGIEYLECDQERAIDLKNVGDADLKITNVEYFTSFPNHFTVDYNFAANGQFPWTVSPGSWNSIYIEYLPLDVTVDSSFLKVHSNDPAAPIMLADQYGEGAYFSSVTDSFTQSTVMMSDILFIIDNSCSMGSWQAHVSNNFDSFITVFKNSGVDLSLKHISR